MSGMGCRVFFRISLVPSITYISAIKIGWAVFEKIWFFDFSKFAYNFCKKFFFELILGVNFSCSGSHLPSQYGSNPSRGTQTMLIWPDLSISCSGIGLLIGFLVFHLIKMSFVIPEACAIIFNTASLVNTFMKQRNKCFLTIV